MARLTITASIVLAALAACSTAPVFDGSSAVEFDAAQLIVIAENAARDGDPARSAQAAEFVLRNHFNAPQRERARWLAAEGRFATREYESALVHYRRLLEEDPLSQRAPAIPDRLITIGRDLSREPSTWLPDLSSRHDVGVEALTLLVTHYPSHEHADDAWRELALGFRADGLHQAAADCFERLARDFPRGEWADFALYNVALEYRTMSRGERFDVEPLLVAWGALGRYLEIFPDGNFVSAAAEERRVIENEVAARELRLAEFYRFRGNTEGERIHLANAARRFPAAPAALEATKLAAARGIDLGGVDSTDLLRQRVDRPRWETATEGRFVGEGEDGVGIR
jgi:tetratricopeptide (TPR) repeat protein